MSKVEWKFLNDMCCIYDGTHQTPKYTNAGVKFVSVENINAPYKSSKYISEDDYSQNYKTKPQKGDVLMTRIGDVGSIVINDRKLMSSNGILVIIVNIDLENKKLLSLPMITTRGYILVNENEALIKQIEKNSSYIINNKLKDKNATYNDIKNELINGLMPFLSKKTGRIPIILPIIMNINTKK